MDTTMPDTQHFARAEMLIRKPVEVVFDAIINPEVTTKFWFTGSSGRLDENKKIEWVWEMYQVSLSVIIESIEPGKKIIMDWGRSGEMTRVEWTFKSKGENETFVSVTNSGFKGTQDRIISMVRDSTEGFTIVLAGLKAWLEFGIRLNLVADRFPG
jgi:uncharacterized protein YndB with AHSA1/START domain